MENAPQADESVKKLARASGHKSTTLTDNWIHFSKSKISCRLNVGAGDIIEQISGKTNINNILF